MWCFFVKAGNLQVEALAEVCAAPYLLNVKVKLVQVLDGLR